MNRKQLDSIAKRLTDQGQPVAAGFVMAQMSGIVPAEATPEQVEQLRLMFMSGAQHLWGMIFSFLEAGSEETPNDMRRMSIVDSELTAFYNEMAAKRGMPPHPTGRSGRA